MAVKLYAMATDYKPLGRGGEGSSTPVRGLPHNCRRPSGRTCGATARARHPELAAQRLRRIYVGRAGPLMTAGLSNWGQILRFAALALDDRTSERAGTWLSMSA